MSPEQARREPVDKRTDIRAFGIVPWEMLTGKRPFAAATVPDALDGVLQKPVPKDGLPAKTPPALRHLLERYLERDTDKRLRDIGDARAELEAAREELDAGPITEGPRGGFHEVRRLASGR